MTGDTALADEHAPAPGRAGAGRALDADRRVTLEIAVEFLQAARELNAIAGQLGASKGDARKRNRLKALAERFQDRGLQMVVRDLARVTAGQG